MDRTGADAVAGSRETNGFLAQHNPFDPPQPPSLAAAAATGVRVLSPSTASSASSAAALAREGQGRSQLGYLRPIPPVASTHSVSIRKPLSVRPEHVLFQGLDRKAEASPSREEIESVAFTPSVYDYADDVRISYYSFLEEEDRSRQSMNRVFRQRMRKFNIYYDDRTGSFRENVAFCLPSEAVAHVYELLARLMDMNGLVVELPIRS